MPPALGIAAVLATALLGSTAAVRGLSPRELAGKRIFHEGRSGSGAEIRAVVGAGTPVSAAVLPCASCHGADGLGRAEGGVVASDLRWTELVRPDGHLHPGRRHRAFDERSVVRAVTEGVDPAGNVLDAAMPRYSLSREDGESLLAYLQALERDTDPGVSPAALRVGAVLPTRGRLAEAGAAMREVLEASFARVNAGGGVHGRRLELEVAGYDADHGGAAGALRSLLAGAPPFAAVSGLASGADDALAALAERERVPLVAFGGAPPSAAAGRYAFFALPGPCEEARVLARYLAREGGAPPPRTAVLYGADAALESSARAAAAELAAASAGRVEVARFGGERPAADIERLRRDGIERVLFLGSDGELRSFLGRADAAGYAPRVGVPGSLAARAAAAAPRSFDGRIVVAYPSLPPRERGGPERLERLRREAGIRDRSPVAQVAAFTAAAVLEEGLRRAGRALTRERLVDALEGLYRFDTGVVPPLSFGPARRVGALGGYVVAVDSARRTLTPVSGWIGLE